ncbi:glucan 1,6-alpha-glucosidase [Amphibacillus marinus]|uniref:Glucan 1,6-alpha-glucosidase n=1 Tax=Amphibacillus marinus TaxID=872970 RepID=A0A1H8MW78_9BACI|nr:alpha-glucosidase [Amphibacillus marinus]SEO21539.1 glucan 1,6-alpha-glucosidase [Amphibacillus marinus]
MWWKEAVVYQIYPRSFQDSNGDGVGDIPGIIQRLDYLDQLGIDAIWLSPVYKSPNDDNGYDISDYQAINPEYGTMRDMEMLIEQAKKRNIKIVMDLVVNHTSDEHEWFIEAKKGQGNPYRDYYIWRDPVNGGEPNDLGSAFSGSAWAYDETSDQYYLHLFSRKQPDLNWENPKVRSNIYNMMNFWLEKGIGGLRMDVIDLIGKEPDRGITANGPNLHTYLQEMHKESFGKYDVMTVGETWSATPEIAKLYSGQDRDELSMIFQFEHMMLDQEEGNKWEQKPLDLVKLKRVLAKWQVELGDDGWNSLFWNNHDTPRIVSRWGNDRKYREESAKCFAVLLHLMKGTPYIYQGEEIGMTNNLINEIEEVDDIESRNMYKEGIQKGIKSDHLISSINRIGRDNARTPMQWNSKKFSGFTEGKPWLKLNPNYEEINIECVLNQPDSIFYTYQELIAYRKSHPIVVHGDFNLLLENHRTIFAYQRTYQGNKLIVIANLSEHQSDDVQLSESLGLTAVLFSNYARIKVDLKKISLAPYECIVVEG